MNARPPLPHACLVVAALLCLYPARDVSAGWAAGVATGSNTSPGALVLKSTDGESITLDGGSCYGACFSPDISEVAYVRGVDLHVVGVDGEGRRTVKSGGMSTSDAQANTLSWCINGYLYYSRGWSIYRVRDDGSGSEEHVHTSRFSGDGDLIRQLQVCRDGSRAASWGRPNGDGHCILYPVGTPSGDKRYSNHCMGAVSKSGASFNATFASHTETGIFAWSRAPASITNNSSAPDELGIGADEVLSRRTGSVWMVRFSQCDEDFVCWLEDPRGYVVRVSTGATVGSWRDFCPQDYTDGDLATGSGPTVYLQHPAEGSSWLPGSAVPLRAQVSAGDAAIASVTFSINGLEVATRTTPPYEAMWTAVEEGRVVVAADVVDVEGHTDSQRATITVAGCYAYPDSIPHVLPARIEAEHFDYGGPGLAYADEDVGNERGTFRSTEDVDVAVDDTRTYVTKTRAGEWLSYTVSAPSAGTYEARVMAANGTEAGAFHIAVDGQDVTGPITGGTGDYDNWQELSAGHLVLTSGTHTLTLVFDETGHIVDYLELVPPAPAITLLAPNGGQTLYVGDSLVVSWRTDTSIVSDVVVQLSVDQGETWMDLTEGGSVSVDDPSWGRIAAVLTPDCASTAALVRVVEYGGSRQAMSASAFAVVQQTHAAGHASAVAAVEPQLLIAPCSGGLDITTAQRPRTALVSVYDCRGRIVRRATVCGTARIQLKPARYVVRVLLDGHVQTHTAVVPSS